MATMSLTVTNDLVAQMKQIYPSQYPNNSHPAVGHSGSPYVDVYGNGYWYYYDFHIVLPSNVSSISAITITCSVTNKYTNGVNNPLRFWDKDTGSVSGNTTFSSTQTKTMTWSPTGNYTKGATRSFRLEINSSSAYGVNEVTSISASCTYTASGVRLNVGGSTWKTPQPWVKVNGVWKQAVMWTKVNGTWKS